MVVLIIISVVVLVYISVDSIAALGRRVKHAGVLKLTYPLTSLSHCAMLSPYSWSSFEKPMADEQPSERNVNIASSVHAGAA
jgi:hypothetical protein